MSGSNWLLVFGVALVVAAGLAVVYSEAPRLVPPVVSAGDDARVAERCSIRLFGEGTDPNGGELTFLWTVEEGLGVFGDPTDPRTEFAAPQICDSDGQVLTLTLTATNSDGLSASDNLLMHVCESDKSIPDCVTTPSPSGVAVVNLALDCAGDARKVCDPDSAMPQTKMPASPPNPICITGGTKPDEGMPAEPPCRVAEIDTALDCREDAREVYDLDPAMPQGKTPALPPVDPLCITGGTESHKGMRAEPPVRVAEADLPLDCTRDVREACDPDPAIPQGKMPAMAPDPACITGGMKSHEGMRAEPPSRTTEADPARDCTRDERDACDPGQAMPQGKIPAIASDPVCITGGTKSDEGVRAEPPCFYIPDKMAPMPDMGQCAQPAPRCDNQAPLVDAGEDVTMTEGATVRLTCEAVDPDGDPVTYHWTVERNRGEFADAQELHPLYTAPRLDGCIGESVTLTLTATDGHGASACDSMRVWVATANRAPTVDAGEDFTMTEGATVRLTCEAVDADGDPLSYFWRAERSRGNLADAQELHPLYTAPRLDGCIGESITLTLTATDSRGASACDSLRVWVTNANRPPVVDAGEDFTMAEGAAVRLTCEAIDADGDPLTYVWTAERSRGEFADAQELHPVYKAPLLGGCVGESITLTLTATDSHGASACDSLRVWAAPRRPAADECASSDGCALVVVEGQTIRLLGKASDADGNLSRYCWSASSGEFDSPSALQPCYTAPTLQPCEADRRVTVAFAATDTCGLTSTSHLVLRVTRANRAPSIEVPDAVIRAPSRCVRIDGAHVVDLDGDEVGLLWSVVRGCAALDDNSARRPTLRFCPACEVGEEVLLSLEAQDSQGARSVEFVRVVLVQE